jgi:hypothetical protein
MKILKKEIFTSKLTTVLTNICLNSNRRIYFLKIKVFDSNYYDAKKYIVLSTLSDIGGKNPVLVYGHIISGGIFLIAAVLLFIIFLKQKKKH